MRLAETRVLIDLNLLTFYLVLLIVPLQYIMDLLGKPPSPFLPGVVLAFQSLALIFTLTWRRQSAAHRISDLPALFALWYAVTGAIIITLTLEKGPARDIYNGFETSIPIFLAFAFLVRLLWRQSTKFHRF